MKNYWCMKPHSRQLPRLLIFPPLRISPIALAASIPSPTLVDPYPTPRVEIGAPLLTNNTATQDRLWPLTTQPPTTDFNQGHIWGIVKYVAFKVTQWKSVPHSVLFPSTTKLPVPLRGNRRLILQRLIPQVLLHGSWTVGLPITSRQISKTWLITCPTLAQMMLW